MLNDKLNKYFNEHVTLSRTEATGIVDDVMTDVGNVIKRINELDPLYGSKAQQVGSFYQGLKVKRADEFDLSIPLENIGQLCWAYSKPRYSGFNLPTLEDMTPTMRQDLEIIRKLRPLPEPTRGYLSVSMSNDSIPGHIYHNQTNVLMFDEYLIPFLVKRRLKDLVHKALKDLQLGGL